MVVFALSSGRYIGFRLLDRFDFVIFKFHQPLLISLQIHGCDRFGGGVAPDDTRRIFGLGFVHALGWRSFQHSKDGICQRIRQPPGLIQGRYGIDDSPSVYPFGRVLRPARGLTSIIRPHRPFASPQPLRREASCGCHPE